MRFMSKVLLFTVIGLFFNFSFVFADQHPPICCYVGTGIDLEFGESCQTGGIQVGLANLNNPNPCSAHESERLGCVNSDSTNSCAANDANGKRVYNFPILLNDPNLNFNTYCPNRVPFDEDLCIGNAVIQSNTGNTGSSEGTTGGSSGSGTSTENQQFEDAINTVDSGVEQEFCSQAGGPFGVFIDKFSCESITIAGESCLYNPYIGGILSTEFANDNDVIFDSFESACIPKSQINKCYDYKTQENCELNPSAEYSELLEVGCSWIPSEKFVEDGFFNKKSGICISNANSSKYINQFEYAKRNNLILNPSFEKSEDKWVGLNPSNIVTDIKTYHGTKAINLQPNQIIEQKIQYLTKEITYSPFAYVRAQNPTVDSSIILEITSYDKDGNEIPNPIYRSVKDVDSTTHKVYTKTNFQSYSAPSNVDYIRIRLSTQGAIIDVDAVSFEPTSSDNVIISSQIFKPIESIPSSASYCELCYEEFNLNLCTNLKSDLLGDCSYMVNGPEEEYQVSSSNSGSKDNLYSLLYSWQSQSIANSNLFCELYINKGQCEDPSNYVNSKFSSLHTNIPSGTNLCKWADPYGCYKDTDNNNLPDTHSTIPLLRTSPVEPSFATYDFTKDSVAYPTSDFELACDTLPPQSYFYFTGVDTLQNPLTLLDSSNNLVGNMEMFIEASDMFLDSCSEFDITNKLTLEYIINGEAFFIENPGNQIIQSFQIKEFFQNENIDLVDGPNNFSFMFFDQSGNRGKEWNFNFNMDVNGPEILVAGFDSQNDVLTFGPNSKLNISVLDFSEVKSCSFNLDPISNNLPSEYYLESGEFEIIPSDSVSINWPIPIYNSSVNLDYYRLTLECEDIFGQETLKEIFLRVDFNTEIVLSTPEIFSSYEIDDGFLNSPTELIAYSSEYSLTQCTLDFPNQDFIESNVVINFNEDGFSIPRFSGITFYQTLISNVEFTSDGIKTGTLNCEDSIGNSHSENLEYYYDTKKPKFNNYRIFDSREGNVESVLEINNKFYTINPSSSSTSDIGLALEVDGTLSYIDDDFFEINILDNLPFATITNIDFDIELNESTKVANIIVTNFEINKEDYHGIETNEDNLYLLKYVVEVKDKAGNLNSTEIEYFYDGSTPKFIFGEDIKFQDENSIYTDIPNPNIEITFDSPDYRLFTCGVDISLGSGSQTFVKDFSATNLISFSLTEVLGNSFQMSDESKVIMDFSCEDEFGVKINRIFTLSQDTVNPILNEISFSKSNVRFLRNDANAAYFPIMDSINFILEDTQEEKITCEYNIITKTVDYNCDAENKSIEFSKNGIKRTSELNLIGGANIIGDEICIRTSDFDTNQTNTINSGDNLETGIIVEATCYDKVGLPSETKFVTMNINYSNNLLLDFNFDYTENGVVAVVRSLSEFAEIRIKKENENIIFGSLIDSDFENGIYTYVSSPLDLSSLPEGESNISAHGFESGGTSIDALTQKVIVDRTKPTLKYSLPQAKIEDSSKNISSKIIYTPRFELSFTAQDTKAIREVEVIIDDISSFTSNNLSEFYGVHVVAPTTENNFNTFSDNLKIYNGNLIIQNLVPQKNTSIIIIAKDKHSNTIQKEINLFYEDGFIMEIEESDSAKLDEDGLGWVTGVLNPELKLSSTQNFSSCDFGINPQLQSLNNRGDKIIFNVNENIINLDEKINQKTQLQVSCEYVLDGINRIFESSFPIKYVDSLPDYTLSSELGFILTDEPYTTKITLNSVGVYRRLSSCDYNLAGISGTLNLSNSRTFETLLNFSDEIFVTREYNLTISCTDFLENVGPDKTYTFKVDKNSQLSIEDTKLIGNLNEYMSTENNEIIYISEYENLDLSFNVNKRDATCSYTIIDNDGIYKKFVNFFTNIFGENYETISNIQDEIYTRKISNLNFNLGESIENKLKIRCETEDGTLFTENEYNIILDTNPIDIEILRSGIN